MEEKNNVAAESAVETTTQTNSPQVEAQDVTEQTTQSQQVVEPELPVSEEERRRAFQDQRLRIKQLEEETESYRQEREARTQNESAFSSFRQPTQPVGPVNINQFTSPVTGEVDWNAYNSAVQYNAAQMAANQARQTVTEQLDETNARSKYPEVFKNRALEEQVASTYLFRRLNGQPASVEQIAAEVARGQGKALEKAAQEGAEQALSELSEKEQAALQTTGLTSSPARQAQRVEEEQATRHTIRRGGKSGEEALAAALGSNRGWRNN